MSDFFLKLAIAALVVFLMWRWMKWVVLGSRAKQNPRPGELWVFVDKADGPWPKDYPPVKVTDVRDGWVRYDMAFLRDQRLPLDQFARMYRQAASA